MPLDGSRLALRILEPLERLLDRTTTELTLLRVVEPHSSVAYDGLAAAELTMEVQLAEVRERLGLRSRIRSHLVRGDPATEISRYARDSSHDLVAMSTHGRTGLERLLRGSVAEAVVRTCDLPLLLCNPLSFRPCAEVRFAHIVVALDGSERSARVLPFVERIAAAHHSHVGTLHVEPSPTASASPPAHGDVVTEILSHAERADLLSMATHGRSGVSRWWFGSVTEEVLRRARCPLLVVRAN